MEALVTQSGRVIMLGGTRSQRRRGFLDRHSRLALRPPDITGMKVVNVSYRDGSEVRTPYGHKLIRRRHAKNAVAKQSRKGNR